jgi:hypothetical protein
MIWKARRWRRCRPTQLSLAFDATAPPFAPISAGGPGARLPPGSGRPELPPRGSQPQRRAPARAPGNATALRHLPHAVPNCQTSRVMIVILYKSTYFVVMTSAAIICRNLPLFFSQG